MRLGSGPGVAKISAKIYEYLSGLFLLEGFNLSNVVQLHCFLGKIGVYKGLCKMPVKLVKLCCLPGIFYHEYQKRLQFFILQVTLRKDVGAKIVGYKHGGRVAQALSQKFHSQFVRSFGLWRQRLVNLAIVLYGIFCFGIEFYRVKMGVDITCQSGIGVGGTHHVFAPAAPVGINID